MKKSLFILIVLLALAGSILLLFFPMQSAAADPTGASYVATTGAETITDVATVANKAYFGANYTWVMICAFMVFFFQCGFAMVETGFCRGKNAAHTITMNFMVFLVGAIGYFLVGFALQMGGSGGAAGLGSGGAALNAMISKSPGSAASSATRASCSTAPMTRASMRSSSSRWCLWTPRSRFPPARWRSA